MIFNVIIYSFWKMLEDFCRELVTDNRKVTVLTGPLFKPKRGENNKNFVLYEVTTLYMLLQFLVVLLYR